MRSRPRSSRAGTPSASVRRRRRTGTAVHQGAHAVVGLLSREIGDIRKGGCRGPVDGAERRLLVDPEGSVRRAGVLRRHGRAGPGCPAGAAERSRPRRPGARSARSPAAWRTAGHLSAAPVAGRTRGAAVSGRAGMLFQDRGKVPAVGEAKLQDFRTVGDAAAGPDEVVAQFPQFRAGPAAGAQGRELRGAERTRRARRRVRC